MVIPQTLFQKRFVGLESFYLHNIIRLFAVSIFDVFTGIYFFQIFQKFGLNTAQSLSSTAIFISLIYLTHFFVIKPALILINKHGVRFLMLWGNMVLVAFAAILYLAKFDITFLALASIIAGIYIGLYYTGYHIFFSELTDDHRQGKELALGVSLPAFASIFSPIIGALLINSFGFGGVLLVMGILLIIANTPLKFIPTYKNDIHVNIEKSYHSVFSKSQRHHWISLTGSAITDATTQYLWPLFGFFVLSEAYLRVGFLGSLIALVSIASTLVIGFLIDKFGSKKILRILAISDSITWLFRALSQTSLLVFISSALQAITTQGQHLAIDTIVYEKARDGASYKFIIQREIAYSIGKFLYLLLLGILFWLGLPLLTSFIISAIAVLFARKFN